MNFNRKDLLNFFLVPLWVLLLGVGFWQLLSYANTPGKAARLLQQWPETTRIVRNPTMSTLLLFAHPRCPCSEASVGELERLMPKIQDSVQSIVVFFKPKNKSEEWAKERLWKKAEAIPGVQVILDEGGAEAEHFAAETSGQTFLYDKNGNLAFSGGITPERGHMGDSDGRNAILSLVATHFSEVGGKMPVTSTPVFGCSIKNPERSLAGDLNDKR